MNNGQFAQWVRAAEAEVHNDGLKASQQAIMLVGFGAVLAKLEARVIRVDGKLIGSILFGGGASIAAIAMKVLGL